MCYYVYLQEKLNLIKGYCVTANIYMYITVLGFKKVKIS